MRQKDKELLLKDLSTRLPFRVKIHLETLEYGELIGTLDAVYPTEERVIVDELDKAIAPINVRCGGFKIEENEVKPYLRPMSSMTEEEKEEYCKLCYNYHNIYFESVSSIDWLNKKMFAYRTIGGKDMFELGLALEAPERMYKHFGDMDVVITSVEHKDKL